MTGLLIPFQAQGTRFFEPNVPCAGGCLRPLIPALWQSPVFHPQRKFWRPARRRRIVFWGFRPETIWPSRGRWEGISKPLPMLNGCLTKQFQVKMLKTDVKTASA